MGDIDGGEHKGSIRQTCAHRMKPATVVRLPTLENTECECHNSVAICRKLPGYWYVLSLEREGTQVQIRSNAIPGNQYFLVPFSSSRSRPFLVQEEYRLSQLLKLPAEIKNPEEREDSCQLSSFLKRDRVEMRPRLARLHRVFTLETRALQIGQGSFSWPGS
jgi:hypothetical protein